MQFGGGKLFLWGEKIGKTSENKQNLLLFLKLGGGGGGGGFPPLRPWKKKITVPSEKKKKFYVIIGASLSEPHTSVTVLRTRVSIRLSD